MATRPVSTIEIFPDERLTLEERVEKWCVQLCRALQSSYDEHYDAGVAVCLVVIVIVSIMGQVLCHG